MWASSPSEAVTADRERDDGDGNDDGMTAERGGVRGQGDTAVALAAAASSRLWCWSRIRTRELFSEFGSSSAVVAVVAVLPVAPPVFSSGQTPGATGVRGEGRT